MLYHPRVYNHVATSGEENQGTIGVVRLGRIAETNNGVRFGVMANTSFGVVRIGHRTLTETMDLADFSLRVL